MEPIDRTSGQYHPKWELEIEFLNQSEQELWDPLRLQTLILEVLSRNPWKDRNGESLNGSLAMTGPVLRPETHSDHGPCTLTFFEHEGLFLPHQQLYAYEAWTRALAGKVCNGMITEDLGFLLGWAVNIDYNSSLHRHAEEYRLASKPGDVVRMPCGTLAVVVGSRFLCGGHIKEITLRPICGIFRHLWLLWNPQYLRPTEDTINQLAKIGEVPILT